MRIQNAQLTAAKVSNPRFRGKVRRFPRHFKGHFLIGNVQVRILRGQPGSAARRDFTTGNARNARQWRALRIGGRSLGSGFGRFRLELAAGLRRIFEIFPFSGDSDRRLGSIATAGPRAQCRAVVQVVCHTQPRWPASALPEVRRSAQRVRWERW